MLPLNNTTMGTQFLELSPAYGRVEGMLPNVDVAKQLPPLTLVMMKDGFAGDGTGPIDGTFFREEAENPAYSHCNGLPRSQHRKKKAIRISGEKPLA